MTTTTGGTRVCHRYACTEPIPDDGETETCSDQCASVLAVKAMFDKRDPIATMGYGAAVAQVGPLSWLDVRAAS